MEIEIIKKRLDVEAFVKSESQEGAYFKVTSNADGWDCTCPAFLNHGGQCKHIQEVKKNEGHAPESIVFISELRAKVEQNIFEKKGE